MAEIVGFAEAFGGVFAEVAPVLDERARRLLLGAGARQLGRGGIKVIAAATGASKDTVGRGAAELEAGVVADGRVRAPGAGRKPVELTDPDLWPALDRLVVWRAAKSAVGCAGEVAVDAAKSAVAGFRAEGVDGEGVVAGEARRRRCGRRRS